MRHHTIVMGDTCWMQAESLKVEGLCGIGRPYAAARAGQRRFPGPEVADSRCWPHPLICSHLEPTVRITPACRDLCAARATTEGDLLF